MPSEELSGFVPPPVLRRIAQTGRICPESLSFDAVVLVADVAGFTALAERLSDDGPEGSELLAQKLNTSLSLLIDQVTANHGEVATFAGDALTAIWPLDTKSSDPDQQRSTACLAAMRAANGVLSSADDSTLDMAFGVAVGQVWGATIGGYGGRWEFVLAGAAVADATARAARTARRTVDVAAEVRSAALEGELNREVSLGSAGSGVPSIGGEPESLLAFVPRAIVPRLELKHELWVAELRRVTVAFVGLGPLDVTSPNALEPLQRSTLAAQTEVARYGGVLQQIVSDGDRITLIAVWGAPSTNHEGAAARALMAAREIANALWRLGLPSAAGIATGRAFCGVRGNHTRCEWAVLGDVMNVAARLMRAAPDAVLCDEETARSAAGARFTGARKLSVRGRSKPVVAFRPVAVGAPPPADEGMLVGRERECAVIDGLLNDLENGRGALLLIEGEPGIGKTRLLAELRSRAAERDISCLMCVADPIGQSAAYQPWRRVLTEIIATAPASDPEALRENMERAAAKVDLGDLAPAVNAIMPLDIKETPSFERLGSQGRVAALRDLVVALLAARARERATALLVDDAHWLDSASLGLLASIARRVPEMLLVVTSRVPIDNASLDYLQLRRLRTSRLLALSPLTPPDALAIVRRRLGVSRLPEELAASITDRAEGNPFFSEQLALALRDAGHILVEGGVCRLSPSGADLDAIHVPTTIEGVILGRVDRLDSGEQLTLKVASVLGRAFPIEDLAAIHPLNLDAASLDGQLEHLTALDLVLPDGTNRHGTYRFRHAITHEVAYGLLAFQQRREVHRTAAEYYEHANETNRDAILPLLAYHWTRAGVTDRAVHYLDEAGAQSLARHANVEAARFMREALALLDVRNDDSDATTRARCERRLAEAVLRLGGYVASRPHFQAALQLTGRPVPRGSLVWPTIRETLQQLGHRLAPSVTRSLGPDVDDLLQAATAHQRLAEVGFWEHESLSVIYSGIASVNLAERSQPSRELQQAYAVLGFIAGLMRLSRVYAYYQGLARQVGEKVRDPDTSAFAVLLHAVYHSFTGNFDEVHRAAESARAMYLELGDRFRLRECVILRGYACLHHGDFVGARQFFEECLRHAALDGATQGVAWSVGGLIALDLSTGQPIDQAHIDTLDELLAQGIDSGDRTMGHGLLARVCFDRGDRTTALRHARAALELGSRFPPPMFHALSGEAAVADVYFDLWETEGAELWRESSRQSVEALRRFSAWRPFARPRAHLYYGRYLWQSGNKRRAAAVWRKGIAEAERRGFEHEIRSLRAALGNPNGEPC